MVTLSKQQIERFPEKIINFNTDLTTFRDPDTGECYMPGDYEYKLIQHLCNGKKLTNMDEFIGVRQEFEETGKYTSELPNRAPNSLYTKFWKREAKRCVDGYDTGYDFIPGYLYWYWNFCPIRKVVDVSDSGKTGKKRGKRVYGFPNIWDGDYLWFNYLEEAEKRGQHGANIKARGKGYSFKGGSMLNRNFYLIPKSMSYAIANDWGYLDGKDGLLSKAWEQQSFLDEHTEFRTRKLINKSKHKKAGYRIKNQEGVEIETGLFSEIIGISLDGDFDKVRGIRGKLALFEESGNNPVLDKSWVVSRSSFEEDDTVYGLMVAYGTGGSEGARFESLNRMVRKPSEFNIYGVPNVFETGRMQQKSAFFIGDYMNKRSYIDLEGETKGTSHILDAIDKELKEREKVKGNPRLLIQHMAEHPLNIEEASLQTEGSPFDVPKIRRQISELEVNPKYRGTTDYGWIQTDGKGKPRFVQDPLAKYVDNYPTSDKDPVGCVAIFEHPYKDYTDKIPFGMYIAGTDPVDFDRDEVKDTYSLASTFIMNVFSGNIVAEYTGRPQVTDDYYENLRKLLMYYNATCLYEANLKGMFVYFNNKNSTHLLAKEPKILRDEVGFKGAHMKRGYKTNKQTNAYSRQLLNKWTLEELEQYEDEDGQTRTKMRMETIRSKPLLDEMAQWNPDGNFDRVSAMGSLMLYYADREKYIAESREVSKTVADDPFWGKMVGDTRSKTRIGVTNVNGELVVTYNK